MRFNKKFFISLMLICAMIFGNLGVLMAEEENESVIRPNLYTESMEIRTDGKLGLRTYASINKKYIDDLKAKNKTFEYGVVLVPASALEADGKDLKIGQTYMLNGKGYASLKVPAEKNWKIENDRITFTAVLTGISGSGFNTRYAARSYVTVDGITSYGDLAVDSCYSAASNMIKSESVTKTVKDFVKTNVMDACDKSRSSYQDATLTINSSKLSNGEYTLNDSSNGKIRSYKKVLIDGSVTSGTINIENVKIANLEISGNANCTINVKNSIFDTISNTKSLTRSSSNVVLNLTEGNGLDTLKVTNNLTVKGTTKIDNVVIENSVSINLDIPVVNLQVKTDNAAIVIDSVVDNVVLSGTGSVISGSGSYVDIKNSGDNTVVIKEFVDNAIKSVTVKGMYKMTVVLEKPTETALTKDDMAILCHGGKEMTIFGVSTTDNQTYDVSTSVFTKDDYYTFSIEVAPGKIIDKLFEYRVNCPTVTDATVLRSESTRAEFDLFDVDEGGYVYVYIPGHTQIVSKARSTEEITVDLVKKGYKQPISTGFNKVIIDGLRNNVSYDLYYVLESYDGRTSSVHGPLTINGAVQEDPNVSKEYQIVSASETVQNTIVVTLNKKPEETLTLKNFSFICPADSAITIDKATLTTSSDGLTYTIKIPDNYIHFDNSYTAKITFSDGTVAKKQFVVHFNPPKITNRTVERISEDMFKLSFTSDEKGIVYIGTYNSDGSIYDQNLPTPQQIISGQAGATKWALKTGLNEFELDYDGHTDVYMLYQDDAGNYTAYTDYLKIPEYKPSEPEEVPIKIVSATYNAQASTSSGPAFDIEFSQPIDYLVDQSNIQFSAVTGIFNYKLLLENSWVQAKTKIRTKVINYVTFKTGSYKIKISTPYQGKTYDLEAIVEVK